MCELMLQDSQQITKSEDVIPPSLQAGTAQDWVVRTVRVLHCKTPSIPEGAKVLDGEKCFV